MDVAKSHIATLHIVVLKIIATTPYVALVLCTKLKVQILVYHPIYLSIYFFWYHVLARIWTQDLSFMRAPLYQLTYASILLENAYHSIWAYLTEIWIIDLNI